MIHRKLALAVAGVLLSTSFSFSQSAPATQPMAEAAQPIDRFSLTVYSSADPATFDPRGNPSNPYGYGAQPQLPGYGVVREIRSIDLAKGINTLRFTDVAAGIDPTTVSFLSMTDPAGTGVLEQNYEYDLVSPQKLLEKYVDKEVILERYVGDGKMESIRGTLMSSNPGGGVVLKTVDGGVRIVNGYNGIQVADAAGLITKPTLVWQLTAVQRGRHDAQVTYQTDGLTWRADYNILLNETDTKADLGAWVTIVNRSGASYPETRLKLVAGDVQRIQPEQRGYARASKQMAAARDASESDMGFQEKSFFEYHLYTLGRTTTLPDNSVKQIELFDAKTDVPVEKVFVYYGLSEQWRHWSAPSPNYDRNLGAEMNKKVDTYVQIDNREQSGLGIPLPAGRVRVYKRDDADKTNEFIGEDVIQHTPKNEKILIKLGSAFDIVGERTQTDFSFSTDDNWAVETFEIKVRNHKKEPVKVIIKENLLRWSNWNIEKSTDAWTKQDFRTIHIPVDVPADGEKVVKYTVRYTW
ncbi:MAG TPA: hypothetical protein VGB55_13535 [Tepidisphaeraceae bacterium]|jgi:hypothetical protein